MGSRIATRFKEIPGSKTGQRATLCKRCGARIYSLSFLKKRGKSLVAQ